MATFIAGGVAVVVTAVVIFFMKGKIAEGFSKLGAIIKDKIDGIGK